MKAHVLLTYGDQESVWTRVSMFTSMQDVLYADVVGAKQILLGVQAKVGSDFASRLKAVAEGSSSHEVFPVIV